MATKKSEAAGTKVTKTLQPEYVNAPKSVKSAIKRIIALEAALDDVSRSFEILQYLTGRTDVGDFAKRDAEELLKTRISIVEPEIKSSNILPTIINEND